MAGLPRPAQRSRMSLFCSGSVPRSGGIAMRPTRHGGILHLSERNAGNSPNLARFPSTGDRTERTVHPASFPLGQGAKGQERNVPFTCAPPPLGPVNIIRNGPSHLSVRCVHLQRNGTERTVHRPSPPTRRNGTDRSTRPLNGTERTVHRGGLFNVMGRGGIGTPAKHTKFQNHVNSITNTVSAGGVGLIRQLPNRQRVRSVPL